MDNHKNIQYAHSTRDNIMTITILIYKILELQNSLIGQLTTLLKLLTVNKNAYVFVSKNDWKS